MEMEYPSKRLEMVALENNKVFNVVIEKPIGNTVRVELTGNINVVKTNLPSLALENESHVVYNVDFWDNNESSIIWKSKDWLIYFGDDTNRVVNNFVLTTYYRRSLNMDDMIGRVTFLNHHSVTERFVVNLCDKSKGIYF